VQLGNEAPMNSVARRSTAATAGIRRTLGEAGFAWDV
jgi:hypothetical protein